jgi:predicted ATPase with chaperone activity
MLEALGASAQHPSVLRYALSNLGRERAVESLLHCHYAGPAPVTLAQFRTQVVKQALAHERATPASLRESFRDLVLPQSLLDNLGPAINSGKAVLLYGGAGNGKTSVAEAIGRAFRQDVWIPHAIVVDGQIIRIFDPAVHVPAGDPAADTAVESLFREAQEVDPRWVRCRRPVVLTGGELSIEMLDLRYDSVAKYYEAPAHIKATSGVFILDDFGRQRVGTMELLNRWILPLERRVDYMTLHTGMKLELPFDEMVIFSTNFPPKTLMDEAGLRRIHYKVHVPPPTREDFMEIYRRVCEAHNLTPFPDVLSYLLDEFYPRSALVPAGFHPKFIVEHVVARCHFESVPPRVTKDRVQEAARNLLVDEEASTLSSRELRA